MVFWEMVGIVKGGFRWVWVVYILREYFSLFGSWFMFMRFGLFFFLGCLV